MHSSIPVDTPIELLNISPLEISPLISKCQIKVCYVSDLPNRNRSVITEEVARKMAPSLRGACIVGHYEENSGDFEEHNRLVELKNGDAKIIEDTRPYGFVDLNAKVWFQDFLDDDQVIRKYLVTEGYLWTGQYPEASRIITEGNNQSMELDNFLTHGEWATLDNTKMKFFIINEAVISKLCILGEDMEPCFEGANITKSATQYSFDRGTFANQLYSLMQDIKGILSKGGKQAMFDLYTVELGDEMWNSAFTIATGINDKYIVEGVYNNTDDTPDKYFLIASDEENNRVRINFSIGEDGSTTYGVEDNFELPEGYEPVFTREAVNEYLTAQKGAENEDKPDENGEPNTNNTVETYNLEEIPEYIELQTKFAELEQKYTELEAAKNGLDEELASLRSYRLDNERKEKQAMIDSFYMLSDEEKQPIVDKIDEYSVEEIEEKLSVICVRNKVSFAREDDNEGNTGATTFNLNGDGANNDATPDWIKAVLETAKTL